MAAHAGSRAPDRGRVCVLDTVRLVALHCLARRCMHASVHRSAVMGRRWDCCRFAPADCCTRMRAAPPPRPPQAAFVLAAICNQHSKGQLLCAQAGLLQVRLPVRRVPAWCREEQRAHCLPGQLMLHATPRSHSPTPCPAGVHRAAAGGLGGAGQRSGRRLLFPGAGQECKEVGRRQAPGMWPQRGHLDLAPVVQV